MRLSAMVIVVFVLTYLIIQCNYHVIMCFAIYAYGNTSKQNPSVRSAVATTDVIPLN